MSLYNNGVIKLRSCLIWCAFCCIQGRNHVFKVGGPVPWSRVLLPFYRKNRQVYPVWCSRLHNHTIHQKVTWKFGVRPNFGGSGPPTPQWLCPWLRSAYVWLVGPWERVIIVVDLYMMFIRLYLGKKCIVDGSDQPMQILSICRAETNTNSMAWCLPTHRHWLRNS